MIDLIGVIAGIVIFIMVSGESTTGKNMSRREYSRAKRAGVKLGRRRR